MFNECKDNSSEDFLRVVEACLYDETLTDTFGRHAIFDNTDFLEAIYQSIVKPLEEGLLAVHKIAVENLDTWVTDGYISSNLYVRRRQHAQHPMYAAEAEAVAARWYIGSITIGSITGLLY